jgi:hypothetical protein
MIVPNGPTQVRMVLEELESHVGTLLKEHRGGVVAALVAATGRLGACQKEACKVRAHLLDYSGKKVANRYT